MPSGPAPLTCMPTKPEQNDFEQVLYTSQRDSCRIVFAPDNAKEAYYQTSAAFRFAYKYQLPAIVPYDQKLGGELRNADESFFDPEPSPDPKLKLSEEEISEAAHHDSGKSSRESKPRFTAVNRCRRPGSSPRQVIPHEYLQRD